MREIWKKQLSEASTSDQKWVNKIDSQAKEVYCVES